MDRGAWSRLVHGEAKSQTRLSNENNCQPLACCIKTVFRVWVLEQLKWVGSKYVLGSHLNVRILVLSMRRLFRQSKVIFLKRECIMFYSSNEISGI